MSTLPTHITAPLPAIESDIEGFVARADLAPNLDAAIRYALLGGGKRLRPLLTWHCSAATGGDPAAALPAAVAVELIHTFSLVHDDLPAMDDDDLRRGRPTLHVHAGEAMAILAGDAMTVLAFQALEAYPPAMAVRMARELREGTLAMIVGQVYDTLGGLPATATPGERLTLIHANKTGALIRAACRMGAIAGGAGDTALVAITGYAEAVGLMFQIVDDILDVTQATEQLGKRANKDADAGKATFPGVLGLQASREAVRREHGRALAAVASLGDAARPLIDLADYMAMRTR